MVEVLSVSVQTLETEAKQQQQLEGDPLDSKAFSETMAAVVDRVGFDVRKLYLLTSKPPVDKEDLDEICEECKQSALCLVKHSLSALSGHGTCLHEAIYGAVHTFATNARNWAQALAKNKAVGTRETKLLMGYVEESLQMLLKCPHSVGEAIRRRLQTEAGLIDDALSELADEVKESDEQLKQNPSLAEESGAMENDDDDDEFGQTLWIGKQREIVYPAVAFIKAGVKLLRKTAALVADVPERRIRPLEALLLKHAKALSPQTDDVILALYEPEDLQGIADACDALRSTVWRLLWVVLLLLQEEEEEAEHSAQKPNPATPASSVLGVQEPSSMDILQTLTTQLAENNQETWPKLLCTVLSHNLTKISDIVQ